MQQGVFCISLDFELFWGVRDTRTIKDYETNLRNVHIVVPRLLEMFKRYNVHCTWATVGMLFCKDKEELLTYLPLIQPSYTDAAYDPYKYIAENELDPVYHFAPHLVRLISEYEGQELATHTFSHYYCLEEGQNIEQFEADIKAAIKVAAKEYNPPVSLVFPRNQFNEDYLRICKRNGIKIYRGNEVSWLYMAKSSDQESNFRRAIRLIDSYVAISGHHVYNPVALSGSSPVNIPSSRFLRPYDKKLRIIEPLRLRRICQGITYAAKNNKLYHLWWHPHNFGMHIDENFAFLEKILQHVHRMQKQYQMGLMNMREIEQHFDLLKDDE
jgi:peptidoglycan/xylan/chitin deacetylase (PgdA/CDA1 family)